MLAAGTLIAGRYRLERELGRGGMGVVWLATHTVTRRAVAMKFLRGPAHERQELRRRFLREARAAAAVSHPNVVEVLDVFELDDDTPVMVMEFLTGETLGAKLSRDAPLELGECASLLLPAVAAVGAAHARGVVHRDLKPDNVFLSRTEEGVVVKVLDFGIAKLLDAQSGNTGVLTETGSTLGTPCYMSPEQALAEKDTDHRVDVWALGVMLYECLSGARPIEGESVGQVVKHLLETGITPIARLVPGLPAEVSELIASMLAREKTRRPEDLRPVRDVLARHTDVRVRDFGAPGSQASAAPDDPIEAAPAALAATPAPTTRNEAGGDGTLRSGDAPQHTPVNTAGPHAVPTRARSGRRWLGGAVALGAAVVAFGVWRFGTERATGEAQSAAPSSPPAVSATPALGATAPPAVAVPAPAAQTTPVSGSASTPVNRAGAPTPASRSGTKAHPSATAATLATPTPSAAPPLATAAPTATTAAPKPPPTHRGGLAEKPPF